jgi:TPP-dependent pyruvate/acetoin dehydrogenase alpha subunit
MMTPAELIAFEAEVAAAWDAKKIRAPVHLSGDNEGQLIAYFERHFRPGDWVCTTWRSHYHCLLAGVPPSEVMAAVLRGRSITLTFPAHRVVSSAIVGGIVPIALGIALGIKRAGGGEKVHVFSGDMTAMTGVFRECRDYASGHDLPITFVVEDNGKSVLTDTREIWGNISGQGWHNRPYIVEFPERNKNVYAYSYDLPWPHSGAGKRVEF